MILPHPNSNEDLSEKCCSRYFFTAGAKCPLVSLKHTTLDFSNSATRSLEASGISIYPFANWAHPDFGYGEIAQQRMFEQLADLDRGDGAR